MKTIRIIIFAVASFLVLAIVSQKIIRAELALARGETFRFPVSGFDPRDVFRGRYLAIRMENSARENSELGNAKKVYGVIAVDERGLAHVQKLLTEKPEGEPYLALNRQSRYGSGFKPPFERFYMNEKAAPEAERVLNEALRRQGVETVLVLKVYNGFAVAQDLQIDGKSIRELAVK